MDTGRNQKPPMVAWYILHENTQHLISVRQDSYVRRAAD